MNPHANAHELLHDVDDESPIRATALTNNGVQIEAYGNYDQQVGLLAAELLQVASMVDQDAESVIQDVMAQARAFQQRGEQVAVMEGR